MSSDGVVIVMCVMYGSYASCVGVWDLYEMTPACVYLVCSIAWEGSVGFG